MFTDPQSSSATPASETTPTRKFMFERSFDASASGRPPERKPVTLKPEQYDAFKKECYDAGFAAGHKAGLDEQVSHLMAMLNQIGNKIDQVVGHIQSIHKSAEHNTRHLAMTIVKKFLPDLTARNGLQEVEALLSAAVAEMVHEPRLVVRVHESQFDVINEKINAITEQKAYTGKVVVMADAEVATGDCRVEWADGGMERNTAATLATLEKIVTP